MPELKRDKPDCEKCGDSKQIRRMVYSKLYDREIMASTTCECAILKGLKVYFSPIDEKTKLFQLDTKISYKKTFEIDQKLIFFSGKRSQIFKAAKSLLKKLCLKLGWDKLPRYEIVQDSELWNLWWEKDGLAERKRELYDNDLILFEIGNKTDDHSWVPKMLMEMTLSFLNAGCKVWIIYFGTQEFAKSMYSSPEFMNLLVETKVKITKVINAT